VVLTAFISHGTLSSSVEISNSGLLLITSPIKYLIHLYFYQTTGPKIHDLAGSNSAAEMYVLWLC
jgi:hypothetical protein